MKLSFFLLFIFISIFSFGQFPVTVKVGSPTTGYEIKGLLVIDTAVQFTKNYPDTTTANFGLIKLTPGSVIRVADTTLYMRNQTVNKWVLLSKDGSGTVTGANNGLTANTATNVQLGGSLVKNTTIDGGGFNLIYNNGNFGVGVTPSYLFHVESSVSSNYVGVFTNTNSSGRGVAVSVQSTLGGEILGAYGGASGTTNRFSVLASGLVFAPAISSTSSNDMLVGFVNSSGQIVKVTLGTNLSFNGTTLNATGGGGTSNSNVGAAYRWAIPGTNNVKTASNGLYVSIDSTTNANSLTFSVDTASLFPVIPAKGILANELVNNNFDTLLSRSISSIGFARAMVAMGDSYTNPGDNASPFSLSYINQLSVYEGLTLTNLGVAGRGVWQAISSFNSTVNPINNNLTTMFVSLNDLRRTDTTVALTYRKTKNKIANSHKAAFCNQYSKIFVAANSGNVTRGSSFSTAYTPNTVGGKAPNGAYTQTSGDSIYYSFTGQSNVYVLLIGGDSVNQAYAQGEAILYEPATGTVIKDTTFTENNQWDGISDGSNNNQRGPMALIFYDLDATKTYRIKLISRQSTNVFAIDGFGHLVDPANAMIFAVLDPPYMKRLGYTTSPAGASNNVINEGKRIIDSTINSIKRNYPVYLINTNSCYDTTTGTSGDGIHPNNTGHSQIYSCITAGIPPVQHIPADNSIFSIGSNLFYSGSGEVQQLNGYVNASTGITDSTTGVERYFKNNLSIGVANGQGIYGGVTNSENLTLHSTRTFDGKVIFGSPVTSAFNESTGRWSIGNSSGGTASLFIIGNSSLLSDNLITLKQAASQSGTFITGVNSSDVVLFKVFSGGAIQGTGSGASYPGVASYTLQISGGQVFLDGFTGSAGVPFNYRASTHNFLAGSSVSIDAFKIASTGATTFNDGGLAIDTRIESDNQANMLYINGTTDKIGIATAAPTEVLTVNGQIKVFAPQAGDVDSIATWKEGKLSATLASSLTGLPYIALDGLSTATGAITLDLNGVGSFTISNGDLEVSSGNVNFSGQGNNQLGNSADATYFRASGSNGDSKVFIMTPATSGATDGDALTLLDHTTGQIGYAPNLALKWFKEKGEQLAVIDKLGNSTIISPHYFPSDKTKSEDMAWSYYSRNEKIGKEIFIDMLLLARKVEQLTGEKLVYINNLR